MNFEEYLIDLGFDVGVNNCDGVVILGFLLLKSEASLLASDFSTWEWLIGQMGLPQF